MRFWWFSPNLTPKKIDLARIESGFLDFNSDPLSLRLHPWREKQKTDRKPARNFQKIDRILHILRPFLKQNGQDSVRLVSVFCPSRTVSRPFRICFLSVFIHPAGEEPVVSFRSDTHWNTQYEFAHYVWWKFYSTVWCLFLWFHLRKRRIERVSNSNQGGFSLYEIWDFCTDTSLLSSAAIYCGSNGKKKDGLRMKLGN